MRTKILAAVPSTAVHSHRALSLLAFSLCSLSVVACASDDDNGTAPTISNLTIANSSLVVGQQTTVSGTLGFADPDGDLVDLGVELTLPDQSKQSLPMTALMNVGTMTSGSISWALIVVPPSAGTYKLALWITDMNGNESNRLETAATAQ